MQHPHGSSGQHAAIGMRQGISRTSRGEKDACTSSQVYALPHISCASVNHHEVPGEQICICRGLFSPVTGIVSALAILEACLLGSGVQVAMRVPSKASCHIPSCRAGIAHKTHSRMGGQAICPLFTGHCFLGKAGKITLSPVGVRKIEVFWPGQIDGQAVNQSCFQRPGGASTTVRYR